jgi:hypothetical protein
VQCQGLRPSPAFRRQGAGRCLAPSPYSCEPRPPAIGGPGIFAEACMPTLSVPPVSPAHSLIPGTLALSPTWPDCWQLHYDYGAHVWVLTAGGGAVGWTTTQPYDCAGPNTFDLLLWNHTGFAPPAAITLWPLSDQVCECGNSLSIPVLVGPHRVYPPTLAGSGLGCISTACCGLQCVTGVLCLIATRDQHTSTVFHTGQVIPLTYGRYITPMGIDRGLGWYSDPVGNGVSPQYVFQAQCVLFPPNVPAWQLNVYQGESTLTITWAYPPCPPGQPDTYCCPPLVAHYVESVVAGFSFDLIEPVPAGSCPSGSGPPPNCCPTGTPPLTPTLTLSSVGGACVCFDGSYTLGSVDPPNPTWTGGHALTCPDCSGGGGFIFFVHCVGGQIILQIESTNGDCIVQSIGTPVANCDSFVTGGTVHQADWSPRPACMGDFTWSLS